MASEAVFAVRYGNSSNYEVKIYNKKILFDTTDSYSKHWFYPRYEDKIHEPTITALIAHLAQKDGDILDVGSNLGWYACIAAMFSESKVHAFEMDKENIRRLHNNISLNNLKNVRPVNAACTDVPGTISYWKKPESADSMYTIARESQHNRKCVYVDAITLDEYVNKYCGCVSLIKVDVEGAEKKVLQGARSTIQKFTPHVIVEVHPNNLKYFGDDVGTVLDIFPDVYQISRVESFRDNKYVSFETIEEIDSFKPDVNSMVYAHPDSRSSLSLMSFSEEIYPFQ